MSTTVRDTSPFPPYIDPEAAASSVDNGEVAKYAQLYDRKDEPAFSLLYTALPNIVSRRLPKLRSIRQTALAYTPVKTHQRIWSQESTTSVASEVSPPPSYRTQPPSPTFRSELDTEDELLEQFISAPSSRPSTSGSTTPAVYSRLNPQAEEVFSKSGRYGFSLVKSALEEAAAPEPNVEVGRRLYIDGVGYLLRGLPKHLSSDEEVVLRGALPEGLAMNDVKHSDLAHRSEDRSLTRTENSINERPQSLLHRAAATSTLYTILILSFLVPYVQCGIARIWTFDRQHRISERCVTQITLLFQLLSAQFLAMLAIAWDMNDGQLRNACRDMGVWLIRDVTCGASEGVGKAIEAMRLGEKRAERGRI